MGGVNQAKLKREMQQFTQSATYSARAHVGVAEGVHTLPSLLFDSLVFLYFKQTSTMKKAIKMKRMRITMAMVTTTPMMTAVSTPAGPGGGGGERGTLNRTRQLFVLSSATQTPTHTHICTYAHTW